MKAKDLATLLELIVRKVVKEELKPILKEVRKSSKPIIKEVRKPKQKDPLDISDVLEESRANTSKVNPTQEFTKNPTLNPSSDLALLSGRAWPSFLTKSSR